MDIDTNPRIPAQLAVVAWPDSVIDVLGFPPHDPYSEFVATPRLGPSAVLAWRRLASTLIHRPDGFTVDVVDLRPSPGSGRRHGQKRPDQPHSAPPRRLRPGVLRRREHLRRPPAHPPGVDIAASPIEPRAAATAHGPAGPPRRRAAGGPPGLHPQGSLRWPPSSTPSPRPQRSRTGRRPRPRPGSARGATATVTPPVASRPTGPRSAPTTRSTSPASSARPAGP
jgi:hypothetical protein